MGLPTWGWLLVVGTVTGTLLLLADLSNRNSFVLICQAGTVELHQGRRFPWPFGREAIGGPEYKPVVLTAEADCRTREFHSEDEAALSFLDLILTQVRGALASPGAANLKEARLQLQQALLLTRTHRARRKEAQGMLAELSYREGRSGTTRAENQLRLALSRFQEAQKLDATRFDDLDQWITHLEELLRAISPSPFSHVTTPPGLSGGRGSTTTTTTTTPPPPAPGSQPRPPSSGGGVLM